MAVEDDVSPRSTHPICSEPQQGANISVFIQVFGAPRKECPSLLSVVVQLFQRFNILFLKLVSFLGEMLWEGGYLVYVCMYVCIGPDSPVRRAHHAG